MSTQTAIDVAKWCRKEAEAAMNSLHCGSENHEYKQAHKIADMYLIAAEALEALAAQPQWQEISTAPKDGTRVLLWTVFQGDENCDPFSMAQMAYFDAGNDVDSIWFRNPGWACEMVGTPTHWQPLPPEPEIKP